MHDIGLKRMQLCISLSYLKDVVSREFASSSIARDFITWAENRFLAPPQNYERNYCSPIVGVPPLEDTTVVGDSRDLLDAASAMSSPYPRPGQYTCGANVDIYGSRPLEDEYSNRENYRIDLSQWVEAMIEHLAASGECVHSYFISILTLREYLAVYPMLQRHGYHCNFYQRGAAYISQSYTGLNASGFGIGHPPLSLAVLLERADIFDALLDLYARPHLEYYATVGVGKSQKQIVMTPAFLLCKLMVRRRRSRPSVYKEMLWSMTEHGVSLGRMIPGARETLLSYLRSKDINLNKFKNLLTSI